MESKAFMDTIGEQVMKYIFDENIGLE